MTESVATLNFLLATGGLGLFIAALVLLYDITYNRRVLFAGLIERYGLLLLAVAFVGTAITALVYSEVFGFIPCSLCWTMRIFVFSQALMLVFAYFRQDKVIAFYGLVLSVPGIIVGLYQHYLQMGGSAVVNCPAGAGDCSKRILFEYGFMTFPLLGVALLTFAIMVYWYLYKSQN